MGLVVILAPLTAPDVRFVEPSGLVPRHDPHPVPGTYSELKVGPSSQFLMRPDSKFSRGGRQWSVGKRAGPFTVPCPAPNSRTLQNIAALQERDYHYESEVLTALLYHVRAIL